METVIVLIAALVALAVGWFLGQRGVAPMRAERDALDARARAAETGHAVAQERVAQTELLRMTLDEVTRERDATSRELAALRAGEEERARAHARQIEQMEARFAELAGKALSDAQKAFLDRADQRFHQAGEKSEAQLKALLQPVESTLKRYEEGLQKVEKERVDSYAGLREAVGQLAEGHKVVTRETQRLANVMTASPKHRGRWGEQQLRSILESAGLAENVDFSLQTSISDGERQLRPDCVIRLPGGRCIVVDSKCPLVHFEQAYDEEDEIRRAELLRLHAKALETYANDLGRKGYWRQFDISPEFVIMFIPGEHFLSAAAERAPELIEAAFKNGVIIASTINMLALAKVMAGMWRQEALAAQAQEIAEAGKELYKRLATMGDHVGKLGRNLAQATGAYNSFVGSLESQVLTQARRFETLKVETGGKTIEPAPLVETALRPMTKLVTSEAAEAQAAE